MDVTWIKLATGLFGDTKIKYLRQQKSGDSIALFWVGLLTLAGECNDKGMIYVTPKVAYTYQGLADSLGFPLVVVKKAIPLFVSLDMLEENNGFLWIVNWNEHQNVDGLEEIREYNRIAQRRSRERRKQANEQIVNDNVNDNVIDKTGANVIDCQKEEKSSKKEETQEGEIDLDIDNSSNSSLGGECACARVEPPLKNTLEEVLNKKFFCHYARYPTRKELVEVCEMMKKEKQDSLSDDELYLLEVSFASSVKAQVKETRYLAGCFRNFEKRGIKTRHQYEEALARIEARRQQIAEENAKNGNATSYGSSDIFWEVAMVAGLKDW